MVYFSCGPQGGQSTSPNNFQRITEDTLYGTVTNVNVLDAHTKLTFSRVIGLQYITVTNNGTGFQWSFAINGGSDTLTNGYLVNYPADSNYSIAGPPPVGCTIVAGPTPTDLRVNTYTVTTTDNKIYNLFFSPFTSVLPQIQLASTSPTTIGNNTVTLEIEFFRWMNK
jgi:hypothetical protein